MRIKNVRYHWLLLCVVSVILFLLFLRSTWRAENIELKKERHGRSFNKDEEDKVKRLTSLVNDLQKQLWDAQRYEKQLTDQLKNIDAKPIGVPISEAPARQGQIDNGDRIKNLTKYDRIENVKKEFDKKEPTSNSSVDILGCQDINRIRILGTVGKGHSKIVQEGVFSGRLVAVKSASVEVKDVQDCLKSGMYKKQEDCYVLASYKVLKEAMMLKQLAHTNIVRLLGLCLRSERSSPHIQERGMTVVVELGDPVNIQELAELPFVERVKLCLGLAKLFAYLAESPLGSLAVQDFRGDQFVVINKQIKLTDIDDLSSTEPDCNAKMECVIKSMKTNIKCASNMKCPGLNARKNLIYAHTVFFQPLLGFEIPPDYVVQSTSILKALRKGEMDANEVAVEIHSLLTFVIRNTPPPPTDPVVFL